MRLKRSMARFVLVMLALGTVFSLVSLLIRPNFQFERAGAFYLDDSVRAIKGLLGTFGFGALITVVIQGRRHLRCPRCGRSFAMPRWKPGQTSYCSRCGEPFVFDDEPGEGAP